MTGSTLEWQKLPLSSRSLLLNGRSQSSLNRSFGQWARTRLYIYIVFRLSYRFQKLDFFYLLKEPLFH